MPFVTFLDEHIFYVYFEFVSDKFNSEDTAYLNIL